MLMKRNEPTPADSQGFPEERDVLNLSGGEWLAVALCVVILLASLPLLHLRGQHTIVEPDYRIPYDLSHRYSRYRQYTHLASHQFSTLLVGDSVVWGQCALRDQTLSHHLNRFAKEPLFANAGLDAMHPIALESLLEFHAPSIAGKKVILHFDPLWLMSRKGQSDEPGKPLGNRPNLVPRLAPSLTGSGGNTVAEVWRRFLRTPPLDRWSDRLQESQLDVLSWSLSHPYENPLSALRTSLPPSEDTFSPRLLPWTFESGNPQVDCTWGGPDTNEQWKAFERLLDLLRLRNNHVLVVVGPINEHMLTASARKGYQTLIQSVAEHLRNRGTLFCIPPVLRREHYGDICHPLGTGYEELALDLLKEQSDWLLEIPHPR
jgi:hypothetical protein